MSGLLRPVVPVVEKRVPRDSIKGSIGRKWGIDGVTMCEEGWPAGIHIEVYTTTATKDVVHRLASLHENGHAACQQDILRNTDTRRSAWNILTGYNRWQAEVEAWMRGLAGYTVDLDDSMLILDCMNSYRRGIPVSDTEWTDFVDLLGTLYNGNTKDLHDYVPLEPDPGEEPRECLPGVFTPDDGRDGEFDDAEDGEGSRHEVDMDNPFDNRWLEQDVLDELATGSSIEDVAKKHGLDTSKLPPLVAAMRT